MNILKKIFFVSFISLSSFSFTEVSLSGNVALTTDYVWRGMTQNDGDPSISGGFDLEDDSGFYLGVWAANVSGGTSSLELDGYLGYSGSFNEDSGYDLGFIAYTYPDNAALDFEELYLTIDFYGVYVTYANGIDTATNYGEVGYSVDAGPGSFSISYGDYEDVGKNYLVGYEYSVGDFTLGFFYSDFNSDSGPSGDQDGGFFTISY
tara:strand:- start:248 stop:865 length:618 start_codon:yes stop_codon:yes gene_type:complete